MVLSNSSAFFEKLIENGLGNLNWKKCLCYLDDIITQNRGVPYFFDTMQTGADQGLELGCMSPAVNILSSSLSITSFVARGVLGAL
jgi:hypothetical protein